MAFIISYLLKKYTSTIYPLSLLSVDYHSSLSGESPRRLIVITNIFPNVWEVDLVIHTGVSVGYSLHINCLGLTTSQGDRRERQEQRERRSRIDLCYKNSWERKTWGRLLLVRDRRIKETDPHTHTHTSTYIQIEKTYNRTLSPKSFLVRSFYG